MVPRYFTFLALSSLTACSPTTRSSPTCDEITARCQTRAQMDLESAQCVVLGLEGDESSCIAAEARCSATCSEPDASLTDAALIDSSFADSDLVDAEQPDARDGGFDVSDTSFDGATPDAASTDAGMDAMPPRRILPLEIGETLEDGRFVPWNDGTRAEYVVGGQGGVMLTPTLRVNGRALPSNYNPETQPLNLRVFYLPISSNPCDPAGIYASSELFEPPSWQLLEDEDFLEARNVLAPFGDCANPEPFDVELRVMVFLTDTVFYSRSVRVTIVAAEGGAE